MAERSQNPSPAEAWAGAEEKALKAEVATGRRVQASKAVQKEGRDMAMDLSRPGREKAGGITESDFPGFRVLAKALEIEKVAEEEAGGLLGEVGSDARVMADFMKQNVIAAIRRHKELMKEREKILKEKTEFLMNGVESPSEAKLRALGKVNAELALIDQKIEELTNSNPEAFVSLHLKELLGYKRDMRRGAIAETPYVAERADEILRSLRADTPVFIHGHLGTGKTELAMHVARKYIGKQALVISGSKNMSSAEIYGHQVLDLHKVNKSELDSFIKEVEAKFAAWQAEHPGATEAKQNRTHTLITQTYLTQLKGGTISEFLKGPIYKAMEEGRPIIIDEVNAIPHELLISLNHILTRHVGETLQIQQDSGMKVTIKDGYCVMMTGNLNQGQETYLDRQDLDPAFLSRVHKVEYDYLPQDIVGTLEDGAGKENELFLLLVSKVMDKNGNATLPENAFQQLWDLAKFARVTQDVFSGQSTDSAYFFTQGAAGPMRYILKEGVLSLRALDHIIKQWMASGYEQELDYYLYKNFISQSTVATDKAYLYQLAKDQFGFFTSAGWEQTPDYGAGGIVNKFAVKPPSNPSKPIKFFGPRELVQFAYGEIPERTEWPQKNAESEEEEVLDEESIRQLRELEEAKPKIDADMEKLSSRVQRICELEGTPQPAQAK